MFSSLNRGKREPSGWLPCGPRSVEKPRAAALRALPVGRGSGVGGGGRRHGAAPQGPEGSGRFPQRVPQAGGVVAGGEELLRRCDRKRVTER